MITSFIADRVEIMPPRKTDNTTVVKFEVGEYQLENLKALFGLLDMNYKVSVEEHAGS